jgi:translation initiation factor IF-2
MAEEKMMRLSQVARLLNMGTSTVLSTLSVKGFKVENNPNAKINAEQLDFLSKEFKTDVLTGSPKKEEAIVATPPPSKTEDSPVLYFRAEPKSVEPVIEKKPEPKPVVAEPIATPETQPVGLKILGKIDLDAHKKPTSTNTPQPVVEEKPQPKAEEKPQFKVEETPQPKAEEKPQPKVEETPQPKVEEKPQPKVEEKPQPVVEEKPQPKAEETLQPKVEEKPQPKAEETPPTKVEETPQPKVEEKPQPKVEEKLDVKIENIKPVDTQVVAEPVVVTPQANTEGKRNVSQSQGGSKSEPTKSQHRIEKKQIKAELLDVIEPTLIEAKGELLKGLTILGKIELPVETPRKGNDKNSNRDKDKKRKRKRLKTGEKVIELTDIRPKQAAKTGDRPAAGGNRPAANVAGGNKTATTTGDNKPAAAGGNKPAAAGGNRPAATTNNTNNSNKKGKKDNRKGGGRDEISQQEVKDSIKATYARLSGTAAGKNFGADKRREKRRVRAEAEEERLSLEQEEEKILKVTEFISANDLSSFMDVTVQEVISVCLSMGMFVSINQRLDAESITLIADEFGFEVQFISAEEEIKVDVVGSEADDPADLVERAPVVTIMGHVDHGKTSLLDYIRRTRVAAGEAGGITQHIGAYDVTTENGRKIAFLDTPGHEAFTAMRARGAKVTDVVIIVIAADDSIMPQTREAINHAQNAGVPIVFAFSKIDKPGANTEKIREALAQMNILVEEWGGKYQTQEISSKSGLGINDLLDKVLLEADLLELKANPKRNAIGTVIEASLDKGRGYLATILVQNGTLKVGDVTLAGANYGRVKAMFNSLGVKIKEAGPSTPVQLLGLNGAPQAGDTFNAMSNEREAREIASKREQLIREQNMRTRKHITLEEIGRRKAIGSFKELNVIVKGDVDGSVEALSDSLLKLSTAEVQVNIINKGVGQIAESDINLAIASDAIVIGFQVRPTTNAKKLAEQEQIEIRMYSIIYNAINDVKDAMVGMLEPTVEEIIVGNAEVREVFKISKVGTIAGCYATDGSIKRNNKIRVLRDFIVIHEGEISALKRFKDDVNEVKYGFEFGMSIKGFNDLEIGDVIESFDFKEVKRSL